VWQVGISGKGKIGNKWAKNTKTGRKSRTVKWKMVVNSGKLTKKQKEYIK